MARWMFGGVVLSKLIPVLIESLCLDGPMDVLLMSRHTNHGYVL